MWTSAVIAQINFCANIQENDYEHESINGEFYVTPPAEESP